MKRKDVTCEAYAMRICHTHYDLRQGDSVLKRLKEELYHLHLELPKNDLVKWTGGNISARDVGSGLVVIKRCAVRNIASGGSRCGELGR